FLAQDVAKSLGLGAHHRASNSSYRFGCHHESSLHVELF
ncbi:hypothetical protein VCHENC02_3155B, partial [Vibrio harveyi]